MGTVAPDGEDPESWPMANPEDVGADGEEDDIVADDPALWLGGTSFGASAQAASSNDAEKIITDERQSAGETFDFIKTPSRKKNNLPGHFKLRIALTPCL